MKLKFWPAMAFEKNETIHDIITLVTCLMCNLQTRNHFQTKPLDQFDDVTNQHHFSRCILSVNFIFILYQQKVKKSGRDWFCLCKSWSVNYGCYWKITLWLRGDTSHCAIPFSKFQEKTPSRIKDIKTFYPGDVKSAHAPSPLCRRRVREKFIQVEDIHSNFKYTFTFRAFIYF